MTIPVITTATPNSITPAPGAVTVDLAITTNAASIAMTVTHFTVVAVEVPIALATTASSAASSRCFRLQPTTITA